MGPVLPTGKGLGGGHRNAPCDGEDRDYPRMDADTAVLEEKTAVKEGFPERQRGVNWVKGSQLVQEVKARHRTPGQFLRKKIKSKK